MCTQLIEKSVYLPIIHDTDAEKTIVTNWDTLSKKFKILNEKLIILPRVLYGKRSIAFYKLYDEWYLPRKKAIDEESKRIKEAEETKKREQAEKRRIAAANRKLQKQEQISSVSYSDTPSNIQEQVAHVLENANVRRVTRSMRRVETQQLENPRRDIAEQALEAAQRLDGLINIINNQDEAQVQMPNIIEPPPEPVQINRILAPQGNGGIGRYRLLE